MGFEAHAQEKVLTGIIDNIKTDCLTINGEILQFSAEPVIIFMHIYGSELIEDPGLIPAKVFAQCKINRDKKVTEITFYNSNIKTSIEGNSVFSFNEPIDNYQISPDERYLAFYSKELNLLTVIDLENKRTLWQQSTQSHVYEWIPDNNKNILAFIKEEQNEIIISSIDLSSLKEKNIYYIPGSHTFIDNIWWSPQGNYLGILVIKGQENAHGYSDLIVINKLGELVFQKVDNINSINWSNYENYIVLSKFTSDDYLRNKIQLFNFKTKKEIPLPDAEGLKLEPFFSQDEKGMYFSTIKDLYQEVYCYDFFNSTKLIFRDLKYLENFSWVNKEKFVFTTGPQPQILIYNTQNNDFESLGYGSQPTIINNNIYFLSSSSEDQQKILRKYSLQTD